jgi:hypothetical protein
LNERESKFVVAGKPVNRRTALRQAAQAPVAVSPVAQARLRTSQARNRLGAALAEQLRAPAAQAPARVPRKAIAGGVLATGGAVGLFLGWLQASMLAGGVGLAALLGGLWLARPRPAAGPTVPTAGVPLLDAESIATFDRALEAVAAEVPAGVVQHLVEVKALVVRLARHPAAARVDEFFVLEDRMYVNECVRRYLPDSLQSYLSVPANQRGTPVAGGETPEALLLSQLALLKGELKSREAKLARSAAEALLRQERFLQSKKGS